MRVARIAGIDLKVNLFFLLLAIIYGYLGLLWEVILIVSSVIIHEFAHTVVGLLLGIKVAEIEMFPFGGQAKIESFHGLDPDKEIFVALAGPLSSLSIAALFYFMPLSINTLYLHLLININLALAIFNFIPVLPLDGGRVLRAILSSSIGFRKATKIVATMGKIAGVILFLGGIYLSWFYFSGANLVVIGIMLFWAANQEGKLLMYSFMRFLVKKKTELSAKGFLPSRQLVSSPDARVKEILNAAKPVYYMLVVVIDKNHGVIGILSEAELIEQMLERGPSVIIRDCLSS